MLILVIVLFLICWGSRICMEISIKVGLESFSQGIYFLRVVINMLPYVHSCLNPFIYSLMSKNFRRSMWRRIHSCCCCICDNSACCVRRRCFCRPSAAFSSLARTGQDATTYGDRSPGGQRRYCRHCRQFSSQYNLNDLSVGMAAGVSLNAPQERTEPGRMAVSNGSYRMRGITSRLAKGSNDAIGGSSPLLLMRPRSSVCSTSVIPECTENFEVDCGLWERKLNKKYSNSNIKNILKRYIFFLPHYNVAVKGNLFSTAMDAITWLRTNMLPPTQNNKLLDLHVWWFEHPLSTRTRSFYPTTYDFYWRYFLPTPFFIRCHVIYFITQSFTKNAHICYFSELTCIWK